MKARTRLAACVTVGLGVFATLAAFTPFSVFDGAEIECQVGAAQTTVTLTSTARRVVLQLLTPEPGRVTKDGTDVSRTATTAEFDASETAWRADAATGFTFVKFHHQGGTTSIDL